MPDPINAFSIFVMLMSMIIFAWRGEYPYAFWFLGISSFLIYLEFYKKSKSKSKE